MSYKYAILKDNPTAFWDVSASTSTTTTTYYSSSAGLMKTGSASTTAVFIDYLKGASANFINPSYSVPALVSNAASALKIKSGNQLVIKQVSDEFYANFEQTTFSIEFWFSFDFSFKGSGYSVNSASATRYFTNNTLKIMRMVGPGGEFGSIYYDYDDNKFVFTIPAVTGGTSTDAYYVPNNLDGTFHVVAIYDKGSLSLFINSVAGKPGSVSTNNLFLSNTRTGGGYGTGLYGYGAYGFPGGNIYFVFEPSTINQAQAFFINNVSFYRYALSQDKIRSHMTMAFYLPDTTKYALGKNISTFKTIDLESDFLYSQSYTGTKFSEKGQTFNIVATNTGLKNRYFPSLVEYSNFGGGATVSASSLIPTASGGAVMGSFNGLIQNNAATISIQAYRSTASATNNIFSINNINKNDYIYCVSSSTGYQLNYYDVIQSASSNILTISTSPSVGWHNIAISTDGDTVYFYADGITASSTTSPIYYSESSKTLIGNYINNILPSTDTQFKNLGVAASVTSNFSSFDFTKNNMLLAKMQGNLIVSQTGYWQDIIPISANFPIYIKGSKMTWTGMDNCLVETSIDNGTTWVTAERENYIPGIKTQTVSGDVKDLRVRVTLTTDSLIEEPSQSFSSLNISLYRQLGNTSSDNQYSMSEAYTSSATNSYIKTATQTKILTRPKNMGIAFEKESGSVSGYSTISTTSASAYALEFWYRPVSTNSLENQYIFSTASGPSLYVASTTLYLTKDASSTLYVNGAAAGSNYAISAQEMYHIVQVFGASYSGEIYINGASSTKHTNATFSDISLWNSTPTSTEILERYKLYTYNSISEVFDDYSASTSYLFSDLSSDYAVAYKIG